jgi:CRISPR/Cas system CSM-associated protein Csm3 (group 7 of RAMP superfamily)
MNIKYHLRFLSDWHVGSGSGIPGVVDNGVLKDSRNVPVITGKTIKGIVRDSLEDILLLIKEPMPRVFIDAIFGDEGAKEGNAVFYNPSLCLDEDDETSEDFQDFLDYFEERDIGEVRCHTAIEKGTAKKHHLFSEETSDRLFEFFGDIEVDKEYARYVLASLKFTTKIGGKRRRGLGQCQFDIMEPKVEECKSYIETLFKEFKK